MSITAIDDALLESEGRYHVCLPDVPGKSGGDMKEFMDYVQRQVIIPKLNEVIENLETENGGYTAEQTDALLALKADKSDVYDKEETDFLLSAKADSESVCDIDSVRELMAMQTEAKAAGASLRIDDHTQGYQYLNVRLISKNVIPFPYDTERVSQINGITYTVNDDGSVTASGTATASSTLTICFDASHYLPSELVPGDIYTLSFGCDKQVSGCSFSINYYNEPPKGLNYLGWLSVSAGGTKTAFFPDDGYAVRMYINVASGTTVDNVTFYPMLERGNKATGFAPYMEDFSGVTLIVRSDGECEERFVSPDYGAFGEIDALYPYTELSTDSESAGIICVYFRDVGKAINALYKKVMFGG